MKPRKPLRKSTPARAKEMARYRRLKADYLETNSYCERCHCNHIPRYRRQLHHFYGRTGSLLCFVPGFMLVHDTCHEWIETHRNEAVKLGLRAPESLFGRPSKVIPK